MIYAVIYEATPFIIYVGLVCGVMSLLRWHEKWCGQKKIIAAKRGYDMRRKSLDVWCAQHPHSVVAFSHEGIFWAEMSIKHCEKVLDLVEGSEFEKYYALWQELCDMLIPDPDPPPGNRWINTTAREKFSRAVKYYGDGIFYKYRISTFLKTGSR